MRILIDLQGAQSTGSRHRGIGRYSMSLAKSIIENASEHEVLIALNGSFADSVTAIRKELSAVLPQDRIHVWRGMHAGSADRAEAGLRRKGYEIYREAFLSNLNPDIIHVTSMFEGLNDDSVVSIGALPGHHLTSATLYDLIPFIHRRTYLGSKITADWYGRQLAHLRRADLLLGISQSSADEAVTHLGFDSRRVIAIGTAADPQFQRKAVSETRKRQLSRKYGLRRHFIMYTGGIDQRKNIERLIESFGLLP